jgi:hypothetical protein
MGDLEINSNPSRCFVGGAVLESTRAALMEATFWLGRWLIALYVHFWSDDNESSFWLSDLTVALTLIIHVQVDPSLSLVGEVVETAPDLEEVVVCFILFDLVQVIVKILLIHHLITRGSLT